MEKYARVKIVAKLHKLLPTKRIFGTFEINLQRIWIKKQFIKLVLRYKFSADVRLFTVELNYVPKNAQYFLINLESCYYVSLRDLVFCGLNFFKLLQLMK